MVLNELNRSNKYLRYLSFSPLTYNWGGRGVDLTLGHRYKKTRYKSCRYLVAGLQLVTQLFQLALVQCAAHPTIFGRNAEDRDWVIGGAGFPTDET